MRSSPSRYDVRHDGGVSLHICGACGHAEISVDNHAELYEKFLRSQNE
jgi:hypothetical protein